MIEKWRWSNKKHSLIECSRGFLYDLGVNKGRYGYKSGISTSFYFPVDDSLVDGCPAGRGLPSDVPTLSLRSGFRALTPLAYFWKFPESTDKIKRSSSRFWAMLSSRISPPTGFWGNLILHPELCLEICSIPVFGTSRGFGGKRTKTS